MGWGDKGFDADKLKTIVIDCLQELVGGIPAIVQSEPPSAKVVEIDEYEGRMRISGVEKFNAPSVVSSINFFLTTADRDRRKSKGTVLLFVDTENAGKLFKLLGFPLPDDEDDKSMLESCGKLGEKLAGMIKEKIAQEGSGDLVIGPSHNFRNSVLEGVEFNNELTHKQEVSFFYWKRKSIVVEIALGTLARR